MALRQWKVKLVALEIRNELFVKKIKKVEKKEVNLIPSVKVESAEVGGEGGGGRERLCWCITSYTSFILIGSAMFQYFFLCFSYLLVFFDPG